MTPFKYLIVNGDDFGATRGINRGIVEAHLHGIVTSASLMVDMRWSEDAVDLARRAPRLSLGLHVDLPSECRNCPGELHRQFERFRELTGSRPTHLDSHHDVHRDARWLPFFGEFAAEHGLALRSYSPIRSVTNFYGRWDGESHPEQISALNLQRMLAEQLRQGVVELNCHPGYVDSDLCSSYADEREIEVRTLCDPTVHRAVIDQSITLMNHADARALLTSSSP
jgi:predicted glycoside hydrolase/deacetylase ChbG (UPF0249 family)